MLLKKPYAMLIKYFKLLHVILAFLSVYSIYKINSLLMFFNDYLSTQESIVGQNLRGELFEGLMFLIPIIIFMISILLFLLMKRKEKPCIFYLCNTFVYLFVFLITFYAYSFLGEMNVKIADLMNIRVLRDILIIVLVLQSLSMLMTFMRAIGFDIKQFEFLKDLQQLEISEEDQEEFELDFGFDSNERKRKRNRKLRLLKYTYRENRSFVNFIIIIILAIGAYFVYSNINIYNITNKEGKILSTEFYDMEVVDSKLINTGYNGFKITDNYLVVVNLKIKSKGLKTNLMSNNFKLMIGNEKYVPTNKYSSQLIDLGIVYNNNKISEEYNNYLLVYEIPKEYIKKSMKLVYYELAKNVKIKLNLKEAEESLNEYRLGDEVVIDNKEHIILSDYEINDTFTINYDYCIKDNCYSSIQYLLPTLNTNYDKTLLKIVGELKNTGSSSYTSVNDLLLKYATIEYTLNGVTKNYKFQQVSNLKKSENNVYYYEINAEIKNADSIRININTRNCKDYYILK